MTTEARASKIRLLLFDVDGVLTDGVVVDARRRLGVEGVPYPRRRRDRLGAARRAEGRTPVGAARRARPRIGRRSWPCAIVVQGVANKLAAYEQILRGRGPRRRGGRLHGRRPAGPARAGPRGFLGGARRCRDGSARVRELGQHRARRPRRGTRDDRVRSPCPAALGRNRAAVIPDGKPLPPAGRARRAASSASRSGRRGSGTSFRTAAGSIAGAPGSLRTTSSG